MTDFDRFKREINLIQYAASLGYQIYRKKSTRNSVAMRSDYDDKVIISKRSGKWVYFSVYDDQDNGTIIDFIMNRTTKPLPEIIVELKAWMGVMNFCTDPSRYVSYVQEKKADPTRIKRLFNYCSPVYKHDYLESRGLSAETLSSSRFQRRVFKDRFNNAVFPHFKDKQVCGLELKSKNTNLFVRGSEKTLWRSNIRIGDHALIISETPIDAISYQMLHSPSQAFYVATCGGFSSLQANILSRLLCLSKIREIRLIMDNDPGGDQLTDRLSDLINQVGFEGSVSRHSPETRGLDWNDILKCGQH